MTKSVALRLGVSGDREIKGALAGIEDAGTRSFDTIGASADAAARKAQASFDRAARETMSAMERQNRAAEKLAAFAPRTGVQARIETTVSSETGKSARDSAAAFRELLSAQEAYARQAATIRALLDPAAAAQMRLKQEIRETKDVLRAGAITVDEYVARVKQLQKGTAEVRGSSASARAGMQQLSYQIGDVATQFASNTPLATIFAQQISQITQAVQLASGGTSKFAAFLGGPWGIALSSALVVLSPFVAKLFEESEASKAAREATEKHQQAIEALRKAQSEAVTTARRRLALTAAQLELDRQARVATVLTTIGLLEKAKALSRVAQAEATGTFANAGEQTAAADRAAQAGSQVAAIEAQLAEARRQLGEATTAARRSFNLLVGDSVSRDATPEGRLRGEYERRRAAALDGPSNRVGPALREIEAWYARQTKALQDSEKALRDHARAARESGRTLDAAGAAALVTRAGGTVTSANRTFAQQKRLYDAWVAAGRPKDNPVAVPGTSAHERGNGLDIAGLSIPQIRKIFDDAGVRITKIIKERGHIHVEWAGMTAEIADYAKAARDAADAQRELDAALGEVQQAFDPAAAAAGRYNDMLEKISLLLGKGRITPAQAGDYRSGALSQFYADSGFPLDDLRAALGGGTGDGRGSGIDNVVKQADEATNRIVTMMDVLRQHGGDAIDAITNPANWENMGDVARSIIQSIMQDLIQLAIANPLKNLLGLGGGDEGGGGGFFQQLLGFGISALTGGGGKSGGLGNKLKFASGTNSSPAGIALVGEQGPELVRLPGGSRVYPAGETSRMMAGGTKVTVPIVINAQGAGPREIDLLTAEVRQLKSTLPARIVATVGDAQQRRVLR